MKRLTWGLRMTMVLTAMALAAGCQRGHEGGAAKSGHISLSETKKIVVEAENPDAGSIELPMTVEDNADASGGKCLAVPPGSGKPGKGPGEGKEVFGKATYTVDIPQDGKYVFWGRAYWQNGCGNSFKIGFDEGKPYEFNDEVYKRWHWVKGSTVELNAGKHRVTIFNREDGVRLDQFLLTTDADYEPVGLE